MSGLSLLMPPASRHHQWTLEKAPLTQSCWRPLGGNPQLSGVTSLLKGAGGLGKLVPKGPFTLLAPSNDALSALGGGSIDNLLKPENKNVLDNVLKKHILPGKFSPDQIAAGGLKDALGNPLSMGGAKITQSIPTKGGMIQMIDKVLR
jgi:uncharacterized surface protein with fasciclin (FAS1) repeats